MSNIRQKQKLDGLKSEVKKKSSQKKGQKREIKLNQPSLDSIFPLNHQTITLALKKA